ncbi:hypothetical protein AVI49_16550 (plasmid) [Piscirickettsia salmonis]|nr:hypothetical protein AVI49_16550 [Piscirickettsia salmonis]
MKSDCPAIIAKPLCPFNINDEPCANLLITGESGAGKTVQLRSLIKSFHTQGAKVIVLDVGPSFKKLVKELDGYTVPSAFSSLSMTTQHCYPIFTSLFANMPASEQLHQHLSLLAEFSYYVAGGQGLLAEGFSVYEETLKCITENALNQRQEPNFISNLLYACEELDDGKNEQIGVLYKAFTYAEQFFNKNFKDKIKIDFSQDIIHIDDDYLRYMSGDKYQFSIFLCFLTLCYRLAHPAAPIAVCIDEIVQLDSITHLLPLINTYQVNVITTSQLGHHLEHYKKDFQYRAEITLANKGDYTGARRLLLARES